MQRTLAVETKALIESLYQRVTFWESTAKHKANFLHLIGQTNDAAAIPDIASFLLERNRTVAQAAASAVSSLIATLAPAEYVWLDTWMRERSPYRWSYPSTWADFKPNEVARLHLLGEDSVVALGLASFHSSGRVREAALRQLSKTRDGTELPFLLVRLNDWVKPVRDVAKLLVEDRLTLAYTPFFALNIPLVTRLRLVRRGEQNRTIEAIEGLLTSQGPTAVEAGLSSLDRRIRRDCYDIAFRRMMSSELIARALSDTEPTVRSVAASRIGLVAEDDKRQALLSRAMEDRCPPVRRNALESFTSAAEERAYPWLQKALMDPNPSLRGYAQFYIGKVASFDLRAFYRQALDMPEARNLYAVILGLGEVGTTEDERRVLAYTSHDATRIRRAAVRALARIHPKNSTALFLERLSDSSPSVSLEARKGLFKVLSGVRGEDLWKIFKGAKQSHTRRNTLFLLARLSKWDSIRYLLLAATSDDERDQDLARHYIRHWCRNLNSTFMTPTQEQTEQLIVALKASADHLDRSLLSQIECGLRVFSA